MATETKPTIDELKQGMAQAATKGQAFALSAIGMVLIEILRELRTRGESPDR